MCFSEVQLVQILKAEQEKRDLAVTVHVEWGGREPQQGVRVLVRMV